MNKLILKIYPDRILRKKSEELDGIKDKHRTLAHDMVETMRAFKGIGLAAPQVGVSSRIIVVEDLEKKNKGLPFILFNPRLVKKKGRFNFCEGCLSIPEVTADVIRPESVIVEAFDINGKRRKIDTGGLLARVLQHEIDHLDGILFIDRVAFLRRRKILKQISSKVCAKL